MSQQIWDETYLNGFSGLFKGHTEKERQAEIAYAVSKGALRQKQDQYRTKWLSEKAIKTIIKFDNEGKEFYPKFVEEEKAEVKADYVIALEKFMDEDQEAEKLLQDVSLALKIWREEGKHPKNVTPQWIVSGTYPKEPLYAKPVLKNGEWEKTLLDEIL